MNDDLLDSVTYPAPPHVVPTSVSNVVGRSISPSIHAPSAPSDCDSLMNDDPLGTGLARSSNSFNHSNAFHPSFVPFSPSMSAPGASSSVADSAFFQTVSTPHISTGVLLSSDAQNPRYSPPGYYSPIFDLPPPSNVGNFEQLFFSSQQPLVLHQASSSSSVADSASSQTVPEIHISTGVLLSSDALPTQIGKRKLIEIDQSSATNEKNLEDGIKPKPSSKKAKRALLHNSSQLSNLQSGKKSPDLDRNTQLEKMIEELKGVNEILTKNCSCLSLMVRSLETNNVELNSDELNNGELKRKNNQLEWKSRIKIGSLEEKNRKLECANAALMIDNGKLKKQNNELKKENNELKNSNESLKIKIVKIAANSGVTEAQ